MAVQSHGPRAVAQAGGHCVCGHPQKGLTAAGSCRIPLEGWLLEVILVPEWGEGPTRCVRGVSGRGPGHTQL